MISDKNFGRCEETVEESEGRVNIMYKKRTLFSAKMHLEEMVIYMIQYLELRI